jgi:hypothetical protein
LLFRPGNGEGAFASFVPEKITCPKGSAISDPRFSLIGEIDKSVWRVSLVLVVAGVEGKPSNPYPPDLRYHATWFGFAPLIRGEGGFILFLTKKICPTSNPLLRRTWFCPPDKGETRGYDG